jgi:hypothetical protein
MIKALGLAGLASLMLLMGCGGGGESSASNISDQEVPSPSPDGGGGEAVAKFSGTVATGAPMVGAKVEIFNATGSSVATGTTDANGDYTSTALLGGGPYVIKATLGAKVLYSVQASDDGKPVNVNTLSNLVATLASKTGNPDNLVTEIAGDKSILSSSAISSKKDIVKEVVSPVSKVLGLDFDVINTAMKADGTGIDRVLDTVKVNYTPTASGTTTIQVAYISGANGKTPQTITFSSDNTIVSVNGVTFTNGDLFDTTLTKDVQAWVDRTNRCIRTPAKERWKLKDGSDVKEFIAEDCKKLWWNNDHTQVFLTGYRAQDIFENEFSAKDYTEDSLTEAEYVYTTIEDEIIVKGNAKVYKDDGVTPYQRYYFINLKRDPVSNELKIYGNKYIYETTVNSNNYIRYFPYSPGYDFTFSGYGFDIPVKGTRGNNLLKPIPYGTDKEVASAVVTSPDGSKTYLKAESGRDNLSLCTDSTCTKLIQGGIKIIRSDFFDTATGAITTPAHFNDATKKKPTDYVYNGIGGFDQISDSVIQKLPMLGTYKFELTLNDNSKTKVTQFVPMFGRPKTHSEIMATKNKGIFPLLSQASIDGFWRSGDFNADGSFVIDKWKNIFPFKKGSDGNRDKNGDGKIDLAWTGLAQWIYASGLVYEPQNTNSFFTRTNIKTTTTNVSLACSYLTSKTDQKQCKAPNDANSNLFATDSKFFATISYIEIGNYFSDFGANITSYGFYLIEESP